MYTHSTLKVSVLPEKFFWRHVYVCKIFSEIFGVYHKLIKLFSPENFPLYDIVLFIGGVSDPIQNGMGTGGEEGELYSDPSFIFLQLYGCCVLADPEDRPLLLQNNDVSW